MKADAPHILLLNPWIYDFAAYDFWAKPLGLLTLAAILRYHGYTVTYMDCLDRFHPAAPKTNPRLRYGRGPYLKTRLPKPPGLEDVPRFFSRYGIKREWLEADLNSAPRPDLILVTSLMTYWYPGARESIKMLKAAFPETPVFLGGIYASLCSDHAAANTGADRIVTGPGEKDILELCGTATGFSVTLAFDPGDLDTLPYPAFDLQRKLAYVPMLTSRGCPFDCKYCASHFLNPGRMRRNPMAVVEEMRYWHETYDVLDFVFYDDALLVEADLHAVPMLEEIVRSGLRVRFHTPNALHIRGISNQTARLMFDAGFKTLRLGLETAAFDAGRKLDKKVTAAEFTRAVTCLKQAGFSEDQIGAYLLAGLPGQETSVLEDSIRTVRASGITPIPAYYSPIPHTALWQEAVESSRYDIASDPLFTNNAILPCQDRAFSWETVSYLKNLAAGKAT